MMGMTAHRGRRPAGRPAAGDRQQPRAVQHVPAAGGAKIGRASDVVVRDSVFDGNLGTGLWFDESVHGVEVLGGRMRDNAVHGISVELSGAVLVAGNVVADNGESGLKVNDTSDVSIWNNTFTGNDREVDIVQDDRDLDPQGSHLDHSLPLTFRNGPVVLRNNVFAQTARGSDCLLCVEDYSRSDVGRGHEGLGPRQPLPAPVGGPAGDPRALVPRGGRDRVLLVRRLPERDGPGAARSPGQRETRPARR